MSVRHEAVLWSQIEGMQSTLEDVLAFSRPTPCEMTSPATSGKSSTAFAP